MRTAAVAFLAALVMGAVLTPVARAVARRFGALDHALTSRKLHGKPIPRLGGVAIALAFYAPLVALLFVDSETGRHFLADPTKAFGLFAGGFVIVALGVWDDLHGAGAKTKLTVQFAVAAGMYAIGFRIDHVANPFGSPIELGLLGLPFTMLWIAGVVNAMNLIDGLDGLAGGVAFIAIATTFAISVSRVEPLMILFTAALGGAVLGFLFYNFNPASIFMGDTGSMFLGFVLATASIQRGQKASTAIAIVVPIVALGVPIADTLLAMMRRAARGVPLFSGDRGHIHHRLLGLGLSHRQTVLVLYGASFLLGGVALLLTYASSHQAMWLLLALSVLAFAALRALGFVSLSKTRAVLRDRSRNAELRAGVGRAGEAARNAERLLDVWAAARMGADALGASASALHLPGMADQGELAFREGFEVAGRSLFRVAYGLAPERLGARQLELGWDDGRTAIDRDTEIAIELLCEHLSAAIERIERGEEEPRIMAKVVNLRR